MRNRKANGTYKNKKTFKIEINSKPQKKKISGGRGDGITAEVGKREIITLIPRK